jgi:Ca2+-transporting ATPase
MQSFYQFTTEEVFDQLKTSASGLKTEVVPALQKKYGANVLQEAKQKTRLAILLSQFTDIMIIILVIAAIISFVVGEHTDAFVILAIIIGNAWMGYYQEYNAERSVRMLKKCRHNLRLFYVMIILLKLKPTSWYPEILFY